MLKPNFILCIVLFVTFSSCFERANRIVYAAPAANVPYLTEKGDSKATAYFSSNNHGADVTQNGGYDIQGAYAITNNWAVLAGYTHKAIKQGYNYDSIRFHNNGFLSFDAPNFVETNVFDSSVIKYRMSVFEMGTGYSFPLNYRKTAVYTLYGGVDFGRLTMNDAGLDSASNPYSRYYSVNTIKPWVQGAFVFGNAKKAVGFSIGGKFSWLHFGTATTSYSNNELSYFYLDKVNNQTFFLWEPYFNVRATIPGLNWLKLESQVSLCSSVLGYGYPKAATINGSIGLTVDVTTALRKTQSTRTNKWNEYKSAPGGPAGKSF